MFLKDMTHNYLGYMIWNHEYAVNKVYFFMFAQQETAGFKSNPSRIFFFCGQSFAEGVFTVKYKVIMPYLSELKNVSEMSNVLHYLVPYKCLIQVSLLTYLEFVEIIKNVFKKKWLSIFS